MSEEDDFPPVKDWALDCSLQELRDICYKGRFHSNYKDGLQYLLELYVARNKYDKQDLILNILLHVC